MTPDPFGTARLCNALGVSETDQRGLLRRMTEPEMPCQELVELVTAYFEDALDERDRRRFDAHLAECDPCQVYLAQMRETAGLVGRLDADSLSDEARTALLGAFRDSRPGGVGNKPSASSPVNRRGGRGRGRSPMRRDQPDVAERLGKFPSCSPLQVSIASARSPRSLA